MLVISRCFSGAEKRKKTANNTRNKDKQLLATEEGRMKKYVKYFQELLHGNIEEKVTEIEEVRNEKELRNEKEEEMKEYITQHGLNTKKLK